MVARNLRELRVVENMTVKKFSEHLGVNRKKMESYLGGRARPRLETMLKISKIYGITINEFCTNKIEELIHNERKQIRK